jgi:hypothetical protein
VTVTDERPVEAPEQNTLRILDHTGDTMVRWDPRNPVEVAVARQAFTARRAQGALAYRVTNGGRTQGEAIRDFDPEAREIVLTPQMQGG